MRIIMILVVRTLLLFSLLLCSHSAFSKEKEEVHVLILSSYNRSEHLNSIIFDTFERKVEDQDKSIDIISDVFTINFLEKWQPIENQIVLFLKAKSVSFDFCFVIGEPATAFFKIHRNEILGPSVPVIYIGENLLGCSIGIARLDEGITDVYELIKRADAAMYKSKKRGGKMITYYDNTMELHDG